ncbi:MAG TPA: HAD-IA family hydrolase [Ilumatobacter sp.]|nr:HAD-IA family hydrolase [Ilumatobacter sp.]
MSESVRTNLGTAPSGARWRAVFFDFGGVILSSPFEAFNVYEAANGLPTDFLRSVNALNPDVNAWALIERRDITPAEFDERFGDESAALGHRVPGAHVLALLNGSLRPRMVRLLDSVNEAGYLTACLTNNVVSMNHNTDPEVAAVLAKFRFVVESSKVGVRKPDPEFYRIACDLARVTPDEVIFLDDLGVNLKPAAAMGMTTIKVIDPADAIGELTTLLSLDGIV